MSNVLWHDWAGYIGVVLVLLAYLLLQMRVLHGTGLVYQVINALGAGGVIISLMFGSFNTSAFLMELAWVLISVFGIVRGVRVRRQARAAGHKTQAW
ncbi:CBU_0592 family membrane protein [Dyella sp.]|uniref:CBU_0592 family membrane protein n=1 Tax=Dyella sp. TaxID=1869338 RepID=UPI002ED457BF